MRGLIVGAIVLGAWTAAARADRGVYERVSAGAARIDAGGAAVERGTVRIALGARRGALAVEGWLAAVGDDWAYIDCYGDECDAPALPGLGAGGLTVRYLEPLTPHVGLHLHGDLGYAGGWGALDGRAGAGGGFGGGLQVTGRVPLLVLLVPGAWLWWRELPGPRVTLGAHADASLAGYRLEPTGPAPRAARVRDDARAVLVRDLQLGISVGADF